MTEGNDNAFLVEAYNSNYDAIGKNNAHFETKITYISAGLAVLLFAFIQDRCICFGWLFICGVVFSVLSLLLNLISFFYGNNLMGKDAAKIVKLMLMSSVSSRCGVYVYKLSLRTNRKIRCFNLLNLFVLIIGVVFSLIFLIFNI